MKTETRDVLDARRFRFIANHLRFGLGSYVSESGGIREASSSHWYVRTPSIFVSGNKSPASLAEAIDAAILSGVTES